ncbi:hypothetical protein [Rubellimicrobium aerolatum]|uniref:Uncharacterized protein n=1 Tax=Rubellimicrobium aerolatum TaxID=490979 RepID=A0ABW0SDV4_9RHOB|nr:hypothetical protein [Rubellimicrobium aerolatum]MBP1807014.1 hypothetical protein [Rubellimicrobium aerolatum]
MRKLLLTGALMFGAAGIGVLWTQPGAPAAAPAAAASTAAPLGDLSSLQVIVADVQGLATKGDWPVAEARITDFETAWDDAEPTMRPRDVTAWGNVDAAADAALDALRAGSPDEAQVTATLAALSAELAHPTAGGGEATPTVGIVGPDGTVAVTDPNGRPIPCEDMASALRTALAAAGNLTAADKASVDDLQAKGLERCNADDDARADAFFADALTILAP